MSESGSDYSVPARDVPDGWKPFGWNGLTCIIPDEWDVSGIDGRSRQGYFTFDDERTRRLEIKYERARRIGKPDLEKTLESYFAAVRKQVGRKGTFDVDHDIELVDADLMPEEFDYRTYGWTSDMTGRGIIWFCPTCRRIVIAQCLAEKNRANLRELSQVLTSIRCHSDAPTNMWGVFDFAVEVPREFQLESNRLQAGLISLTFSDRKRRLIVDRLGLVHAILKHSSIGEYVAKVHYKKLRRRRLRFTEESWGLNAGYRIEGERFRLLYLIPGVRDFIRRLRRRDHIGGRIWHSEEANRLYVIRAEGADSQELADAVANTIAPTPGE